MALTGIHLSSAFDNQTNKNWLSCIKNNYGISFVGRYYKPTSSSLPTLTKAEAQYISSLGLDVLVFYQERNDRSSDFGYQIGRTQCSRAIARAEEVGQPTSSAIYFAVDFDAYNTTGAMANVRDYFRGINDLMDEYYKSDRKRRKVGIYAGNQVCTDIKSLGLAEYIWQANAWNSGADSAYNVKQTRGNVKESCNNIVLTTDFDEAPISSYGGFRIN